MAEEIPNDSFPDLKELENKVGRKTPESLLIWMRDAVDCEDGWRSDVVEDRGDHSSAFSKSFLHKMHNLKQEMKLLRSADVKILRQLVAVHEGIEALRWLIEDRDTLPSRGSSLTGSMSSLVTVEELGPSMSPCRESLSPTQDLTETTSEESADHPLHSDQGPSDHRSPSVIPESTEARPASPSTSKLNHPTHSRPGYPSWTSSNGLVGASLPKSKPQDSNESPLQGIKGGADTIRRALLRSSRVRREVKADVGIFAPDEQSVKTPVENQTQKSLRVSKNNQRKEESESTKETSLPGYDAQWCWVESQDDVTFL